MGLTCSTMVTKHFVRAQPFPSNKYRALGTQPTSLETENTENKKSIESQV